MTFLEKERELLERLLPGLDQRLAEKELMTFERPGSPAIQMFREAGGAKLLIPEIFGGRDASPLDAVRVHRAIGARSPSLSIVSTMHNFSVATLVELVQREQGVEGLLLEGIARQDLLVASGFAEGKSSQGIFAPTMTASKVEKGYRITGSKKPCTLSRSMDLLTASVSIPEENCTAVAMIPKDTEGVERHPFWHSEILAGAESDEIVLDNVFVDEDLVYPLERNGHVEDTQIGGYIWFQLLVTASYLGVASGLVERVLVAKKGAPADRLSLAIRLESAMAAVGSIAREVPERPCDLDLLARVLLVRYGAQEAITSCASLAAELLGGMAYIGSKSVSYLHASARALAFHPPSRTQTCESLLASMGGGELVLM